MLFDSFSVCIATAFVPFQSWLRQMLLIAVIGVKAVGMKLPA